MINFFYIYKTLLLIIHLPSSLLYSHQGPLFINLYIEEGWNLLLVYAWKMTGGRNLTVFL